jgi:hypothetical protein
MPRPAAFWAALIGSGVAADFVLARGPANGDTLSEVTRQTFRVHSRTGRALAIAFVAGGAAAFLDHIINPQES